MAFDRSKLGLFFSLPLQPVDWDHLKLSKATKLQMPLEFATPDTCKRLAQQGCSLTVRVNERALDDMGRVAIDCHWVQKHIRMDGMIPGNEPEHPFNMRYGSTTWGQDTAYKHRDHVQRAIEIIRPLGIPIISPGWTSRAKDMNWQEGLFPGEQSWLEITRTVYNQCDLNGFHWYSYDGTHYDLWERMRRTLHMEQARRHRSLMISELGVGSGPEQQRVSAYLRLATLLLTTDRGSVWFGSGERVEGLVPFVANGDPGNPPAWQPGFLIKDPASYSVIGRFIEGSDF